MLIGIRRAIGHNHVMPSGSENLPRQLHHAEVGRRGAARQWFVIHRATAAKSSWPTRTPLPVESRMNLK